MAEDRYLLPFCKSFGDSDPLVWGPSPGKKGKNMPEMKKGTFTQSGGRPHFEINESFLQESEEFIALTSPIPLKTLSSAVVGSGTGLYSAFVNRHVNKNYCCSDHQRELAEYLRSRGFEPEETVGMMTAVFPKDVSYRFYEGNGFSVLIVVTAGVGNAVDASNSDSHPLHLTPGTINTWVFVNGTLADEAFVQSIMTATEAKTKALAELKVIDRVTGTVATGTSTDSILIAATQSGKELPYAGTITELGRVIGRGVFTCTHESIRKSMKRRMK